MNGGSFHKSLGAREMAKHASDAFVHLSETERDCVLRYVSLLVDQLAENLLEVWLFGSAARGDMWPDWMPMHSDIDLLVLTEELVPPDMQAMLLNETYPLFLECGRQIAPQFRVATQFHEPADDRAREFGLRVQAEGRLVYPRRSH